MRIDTAAQNYSFDRVSRQNQYRARVLRVQARQALQTDNKDVKASQEKHGAHLKKTKRRISGVKPSAIELPKPQSLIFAENDSAPRVLTGTYTGLPALIINREPSAAGDSGKTTAGDLRTQKNDGPNLNSDYEGCQTCKARKYQDKSDDFGVSFQMAGHIGRNASASVVMGHEREHEKRETEDAEDNGMRVVSTRVRIKMSECPECHKAYASGGETEVLKTKDNAELLNAFKHLRNPQYRNGASAQNDYGKNLDIFS